MEAKTIGLEAEVQDFIPYFIGEFTNNYRNYYIDLNIGSSLQLQRHDGSQRKKINPILQLAKPNDAEVIAALFYQAYDGTYPYKEFEDVEELRKMIDERLINFVLFKKKSGEILGCLKFILDFENKRGYQGGMAVWKKFLGKIDVVKAYVGSCIFFYNQFRDRIFLWYGEARTAHSKVQYFCKKCGVWPLGMFPNKDVFLNKIESDLFVIGYYKKTLDQYRSKTIPRIIPEILRCFTYSNERYNLGPVDIVSPTVKLDPNRLMKLQHNLCVNIAEDRFGYVNIELRLPNTSSYFKFLYTPQIQNFEKVDYKVNNLEELCVFIDEFLRLGRELNIRYCEVFVSAYKPEVQKMFLSAGLRPMGYIPSWQYNKKLNCFEDKIIFNWFKGCISSDIELIQEGWELFQILDLEKNNE